MFAFLCRICVGDHRTTQAFLALVAILATVPSPAAAWWSKDWAYRQAVTLDTTKSGVAITESAENVPVIVRLHAGNFPFASARKDGADLRIIAADDTTPLPYAIDRFDAGNEIAILRVLLPVLEPNKRTAFYIYFGNPTAPSVSDSGAVQDRQTVLAYDFEHMDKTARDRTNFSNNADISTVLSTPGGAVGDGASFTGANRINVPASSSLQFGSGITIAMWMRFDTPQSSLLIELGDPKAHSLAISLAQDKLVAQTTDANGAAAQSASATLPKPGGWHHLAVTMSATALCVFLDGEQKACTQLGATANALPLAGPLSIGAWPDGRAGFLGTLDEIEISKVVRSDAFIRMAAETGVAETRLLAMGSAEQKDQFAAYLGLLATIVNSITVDGWVVIGFIAILGFVSGEVAIRKSFALSGMERADAKFLARHDSGTEAADAGLEAHSPLFRIWRVAQTTSAEQRGRSERAVLVRSAVARTQVDEAARLNKNMVILTMAISGAPFLGLLGTVAGVMITFASVAASGDVNVTTIAPGISAAIAATMAGLIVAIPALFSYNILMSRIRERLNRMEVFGEDIVNRVTIGAAGE